MKKVTIALGLMALVLSVAMNNVLHAGDVSEQDKFYLADEHPGHTGKMSVRGALLSSPCTLITNELKMPFQNESQGRTARYPLQIMLTGCGDGEDVTSVFSPAGRSSVMVVYSALLGGVEGGVLHPNQRMLGVGRATLHGGSSAMTWYLTESQHMALQRATSGQVRAPFNNMKSGSLLRLRMDYE